MSALFHHQPHNRDLSDIYIYLNEEECIGCGVCATNCTRDAINLKKIRDEIPEMTPIEMSKRYNKEKLH